jgi:hypothetical protein
MTPRKYNRIWITGPPTSGKSWVLQELVKAYGLLSAIEIDGVKTAFYPNYHTVKLWKEEPKLWDALIDVSYDAAMNFTFVSGWWPGEHPIPEDALCIAIIQPRFRMEDANLSQDIQTRLSYVEVWEKQFWEFMKCHAYHDQVIRFRQSRHALATIMNRIDTGQIDLLPVPVYIKTVETAAKYTTGDYRNGDIRRKKY